jgi:hypothetical protein
MRSIYYLIIGLVIALTGTFLMLHAQDLRYLGICALGIILMHVACLKVKDE